jgi:hypothetical protein
MEPKMRHTFQIQIYVMAVFLSLAAVLSAQQRLFSAEPGKSPVAKPNTPSSPQKTATTSSVWTTITATTPASPQKTATTAEKLKTLGALLRGALDVTVDLLSGNETDLLSKNHTALLSGNNPKVLSGNSAKVLSENQTPILSGNSFSMFSNIKIEVHIQNSGNTIRPGAAQPSQAPAAKNSARTPPR